MGPCRMGFRVLQHAVEPEISSMYLSDGRGVGILAHDELPEGVGRGVAVHAQLLLVPRTLALAVLAGDVIVLSAGDEVGSDLREGQEGRVQ